MSQFDRALTGWRFCETRGGDTLQEVAARELGDASLWVDLIDINDLKPPFLTGDPSLAGPHVKLYGQLIMVPASSPQATADTDPEAVFGVDIALDGAGRLAATASGDLAIVGGHANLKQALQNRIATDTGELLFHLDYGCKVRRMVGVANGPGAGLIGGQYVRSAILDDPRIDSVSSVTVTVQGDALQIRAVAAAIAGAPITINTGS
jgi:phage baseplate assembly protein W